MKKYIAFIMALAMANLSKQFINKYKTARYEKWAVFIFVYLILFS